MIHTARSRNDQVALDLRMLLRGECDDISSLIRELLKVLAELAEANKETIMPGYTHLQRAQPVSFGHYMMAYAMMLLRDLERVADCRKRINISPIGCCALAGTTYDTDRYMEADLLGFDGIALNSLDGVSDRDFASSGRAGNSGLSGFRTPILQAHPLCRRNATQIWRS